MLDDLQPEMTWDYDYYGPDDDDEDLPPGVEPPRRVIHHVIHQAKPTFWERQEALDLEDEKPFEDPCASI